MNYDQLALLEQNRELTLDDLETDTVVSRIQGMVWADIERKGQPSKWVTLRTLRVIKAVEAVVP